MDFSKKRPQHHPWQMNISARRGSRRSARRLCAVTFVNPLRCCVKTNLGPTQKLQKFYICFVLDKCWHLLMCWKNGEENTEKTNSLMSYAWWFEKKKTFFRRFADLSNAFWKFQDKPCVNVSYVMCNTNPKKDRDVTRAVGWKSSLLTMSVRKKWKWGQIHSSALGRGNRSMAGLCCTWIHSCHKSWRPRMNCMNHESTLTCWIWQHESKS